MIREIFEEVGEKMSQRFALPSLKEILLEGLDSEGNNRQPYRITLEGVATLFITLTISEARISCHAWKKQRHKDFTHTTNTYQHFIFLSHSLLPHPPYQSF